MVGPAASPGYLLSLRAGIRCSSATQRTDCHTDASSVLPIQVLMAHMRHLGDCAQQYRWLGYISSTSVYGNHEGDWVDEQ